MSLFKDDKAEQTIDQREYVTGSEREQETPLGFHEEINERALIRKIDWHIVPVLSILYLLSFLDRTNIGNASLFGLQPDLGLKGMQYSACLAIFFAFYVLFEVPSNMVMKAWRPSMWLPIIMVAWGIVITLTGIVKNFQGLFVARIFLGITEAGLFPGVSFFLTLWYRRHETNLRIALFFSAATVAGAFGGLLARLINLMDGVGGQEGWRWIFILEGILTIVVAIASFWMLYDYPDTAKFLSPAEKAFVKDRLHLDSLVVLHAFLDYKIWLLSFIYIGALMPVYAFSLFSPTLIANLGYTAATAQLLSVPPYVLAALTTVIAGFLSDRAGRRGVFILGFSLLGLVGFTMCIATPNPRIGYAGVFLGAAGIYPLIPLIVSWSANTMGGSLKRSVGMAIVISIGNAGGVISSFIYRAKDKPRYFLGHGVVIGFVAMTFFLTCILMLILSRKNAKRLAIAEARNGRPWSETEKLEQEERGDDADYFIYTL
ncbi:hypothetical protein CI109_102039 [Kwoniella shandongensis]|uniref:Major facilitator superfamily (MFS) profile domain-containing protein n=1 Tax=Kwoniella shandongensis TaxID=1734106 RepID=A0AAJ8LFD9_9TREE